MFRQSRQRCQGQPHHVAARCAEEAFQSISLSVLQFFSSSVLQFFSSSVLQSAARR